MCCFSKDRKVELAVSYSSIEMKLNLCMCLYNTFSPSYSITVSSPGIPSDPVPVSPLKSLTPPPSMTFTKPLTPVGSSSPSSPVPPLVVSRDAVDGKGKGERSQLEEEIYQQG